MGACSFLSNVGVTAGRGVVANNGGDGDDNMVN